MERFDEGQAGKALVSFCVWPFMRMIIQLFARKSDSTGNLAAPETANLAVMNGIKLSRMVCAPDDRLAASAGCLALQYWTGSALEGHGINPAKMGIFRRPLYG